MGKPTGFIDYTRHELPLRSVAKRVQDWEEIKPPTLSHQDSIKEQAARCMDCSVPFCHSGIMLGRALVGCPLHNLMPEFNDLIYNNLDEWAYARLSKTNNFPEFTSHVCPAPCEGACTAGLVTTPVTIKNIEQYVIEKAFADKLVQPQIIHERSGKKVAIIGSGPAGLACADELNKQGHLVTVFERADRAGGLLMYGIPNMKLSKKIVNRRLKLMSKSGIDFVLNTEIGITISSETLLEEYDAVVCATGSTVPRDLPIAGRELEGIHFAKDYLAAATKAYLDKAPESASISAKDKHVVVIGGGDTGTDCVATALRQGASGIIQIEIMPCLPQQRTGSNPWPEFPRVFKTDYGQEEALAVYHKDPRRYCLMSQAFEGKDGKVNKLKVCQVKWCGSGASMHPVPLKGSEEELDAQLVLLAMGFVGTEQKLCEEFALTTTAQNNIAASETDFATNIPKVFAAGDARRGQSLVVWAISEGRRCAAAVHKFLTK